MLIGNKLGNSLKELRKKRGLTQKDLASKSGVSQSTISRIESADIPPIISVAMLSDICDVLGDDDGLLFIMNDMIPICHCVSSIKEAQHIADTLNGM